MKKRLRQAKISIVLLAAVSIPFVPSYPFLTAPAQVPDNNEIVSVELTPRLAARLQPLGLDYLFEWEGRAYVLVSPDEIRRLDQAGIPYLVESHKFPALRPGSSLLQGDINGEYHSYSELEAGLEALELAHPEIAQLSTIGLSLENRKIFALKISDNAAQEEEEAEVVFTGCHHAREWISVEVPFLLAEYLLENYPADPQVRRAVDQGEIWIVPLVNPDGLEYSIRSYRYWRKNRRLNADGSFGVDLNRNYGYAWGHDDSGSSPEPASEVYRGTAPFSEPETRAVRDLFEQRHLRALVSYHSFSQVILYPWGYADIPSGREVRDGSIASAMSLLMRAVNGRVYQYGASSASLYLTNGDTTDWAFGVAGIPAYTIELPPVDELGGGFFNAESDIQPVFRENLPAALYLIDWAISDFGASPSPVGARDEARKGRLRNRDTPQGRPPQSH
jgi:murein tripeptide amidase MpaA